MEQDQIPSSPFSLADRRAKRDYKMALAKLSGVASTFRLIGSFFAWLFFGIVSIISGIFRFILRSILSTRSVIWRLLLWRATIAERDLVQYLRDAEKRAKESTEETRRKSDQEIKRLQGELKIAEAHNALLVDVVKREQERVKTDMAILIRHETEAKALTGAVTGLMARGE